VPQQSDLRCRIDWSAEANEVRTFDRVVHSRYSLMTITWSSCLFSFIALSRSNGVQWVDCATVRYFKRSFTVDLRLPFTSDNSSYANRRTEQQDRPSRCRPASPNTSSLLRPRLTRSFVMQRVNRIQRSSPSSRVKSEENTDHEAHTEGKDDRTGRNDSAEIGYNCDQS